jgi:hypothetical protein
MMAFTLGNSQKANTGSVGHAQDGVSGFRFQVSGFEFREIGQGNGRKKLLSF